MDQPQYKDYLNLIRRMAWSRCQRNPWVEFDELISVGRLAFDKAVQSWDPAKGEFSTHLTWKCRGMMNKVQGCRHHVDRDDTLSLDDPENPLELADPGPGPYEETRFRSMVADLGREAQEVVVLVLTIPWELVDWTMRSVRPSRSGIRDYLRSMGWPHPKINRAFKEIEAGLAEM
jgi:hypothetical protein